MAVFFDQVIGFLQSIFDWIGQSAKSIAFFFTVIAEILPSFAIVLEYMPTILGGTMFATLIVLIARFILMK